MVLLHVIRKQNFGEGKGFKRFDVILIAEIQIIQYVLSINVIYFQLIYFQILEKGSLRVDVKG